MSQHAYDVLEFQKILQMYAAHCETAEGNLRASETVPSFVAARVWSEQYLIAEVWQLFDNGLPSLSGFHDLTSVVGFCAKGGAACPLNPWRCPASRR